MTNQMKAMFVIIFIFSFIVPALAMIRENRQCCHTFAPSSRKVQRKLVTSLEKKKVYSKHLERKNRVFSKYTPMVQTEGIWFMVWPSIGNAPSPQSSTNLYDVMNSGEN